MPTLNEFADRWGITHQRVQQLRDAGMPLDSFESAEAWRASQKGGVAQMKRQAVEAAIQDSSDGGTAGGLPTGPGYDALLDMEDFLSQLEFQRQIVKVNRNEYIKALRRPDGHKDAAKQYSSLNKSIAQLFQIRDKALAHGLATKQLVNAQTVIESIRKGFAIMVQKYEAREIGMAAKANPGDKARALQVIRENRLEIQREVWKAVNAAALSLTGKDQVIPNLDDVSAELAGIQAGEDAQADAALELDQDDEEPIQE